MCINKTFWIIENPKTGKLLESWTFAYCGNIIYCTTTEWAMKFSTKESAEKRLNWINKQNFKNAKNLKITKLTQEINYYE